jgi:uncharacterized metal-binding protein YceD (DUF177 family)
MSAELHRWVEIDQIGPTGLDSVVDANRRECAALAERMGLPAVLSLTCRFRLSRLRDGTVAARGRLAAHVLQVCVISLEEFEASVEEDFRLRFVPEGTESDEFDPEADDEVPFQGGVIDLGEAAAQQLGLALDPYPRRPGAELPETENPAPNHPFGRLSNLRTRH